VIREKSPDSVHRSYFISVVLVAVESSATMLWRLEQAAGTSAKGASTPGGTVHWAAVGGAKIWNSEIWLPLANWRLHCRQ